LAKRGLSPVNFKQPFCEGVGSRRASNPAQPVAHSNGKQGRQTVFENNMNQTFKK
jgi:hypothetical protein